MTDAERVREITVKEQQKIMNTNTLIRQRRQVFSHPGKLEMISDHKIQDYFELIPDPKNRSKEAHKPCDIYNLGDFNGPTKMIIIDGNATNMNHQNYANTTEIADCSNLL